MSKLQRATSISTIDNDSDSARLQQLPSLQDQQAQQMLLNYAKMQSQLEEALKKNEQLQKEMAVLRKENSRLLKKQDRLNDTLKRQVENVTFLQTEVQRVEAELMKSEEESEEKTQIIEQLQRILEDKSHQNEQLRKQINWISARFTVGMKQLLERKPDRQVEANVCELEALRQAYNRLKKVMSRSRLCRQAQLSREIDFVLSDDEAGPL